MALKLKINFPDKEFKNSINRRVENLYKENILDRLLSKDHTIWSKDPKEISNRLAWIDSPEKMMKEIEEINTFVLSTIKEGYDHAVLLGMGGSSLAPEVFKKTFGQKSDYLKLSVLDTTDPTSILRITETIDFSKTLFIVSSKSGGTVETLSLFKYFYSLARNKIAPGSPGKNFIAITDPGSYLEKTANGLGFKKVFLNDPDIGGRFSALSFFGLVPAALIGVDIEKILNSAQAMKNELFTKSDNSNPGLILGAFLGEAALLKNDKLNIFLEKEFSSFGDWAEQLIAESTGKSGKGILPIVGADSLAEKNNYDGNVFVAMSIHPKSKSKIVDKIKNISLPLFAIDLDNKYDLGGQFFLWEFAISIAGKIIGIQPFNQPNVESAKISAREVLNQATLAGELPIIDSSNFKLVELQNFLKDLGVHDYVSIQAYVPPDEKTTNILFNLKRTISKVYKVSVTTGYGPRFLHSTGQLHKGDSGNGHFIQFVSIPPEDISIPDDFISDKSSLTFGNLKISQAIGDAEALKSAKRRVITFKITEKQILELEDWGKEI